MYWRDQINIDVKRGSCRKLSRCIGVAELSWTYLKKRDIDSE